MSDLLDYAGVAESPATFRNDDVENVAQKLLRETSMVASGIRSAAADVLTNPVARLPDIAVAGGFGVGLKTVQRLGGGGRLIAAGIAGGMAINMVARELKGSWWSSFGDAVVDTWNSDRNYDANVFATKNSLGSLVVDTALGAAGFKLAGSSVANRVLFGELGTKVPVRIRTDSLLASSLATTEGAAGRVISPHDIPNYRLNHRFVTMNATSGAPEALVSVTSRGIIDAIGMAKGLSPGQSARLTALIGYAELAGSDAAATDAAIGSTLLGRIGLADGKITMAGALRGAESYVNGVKGNKYANFLTERYGTAPESWVMPQPQSPPAITRIAVPHQGWPAGRDPSVVQLGSWDRQAWMAHEIPHLPSH
ncbi:MAG: L-lactate permease [Cyanobacteria bacterium]|nr:L-lactate permease [Cyanobacteriota bacterium]